MTKKTSAVKKPVKRRKKTYGALTEVKKEQIRQTYPLAGTKTETARQCNVSLRSVYNVLGQTPPQEQAEKHVETLGKMAGRIHEVAGKALTNLETDAKKMQNASYMQQVTGMAIMVDKSIAIDKHLAERREAMKEVQDEDSKFLPKDVAGMVGALSNKISGIDILVARIKTNQPDNEMLQAARSLQDRATELALIEERGTVDPSGVTVLEDLDGRPDSVRETS